MSKLQELRIKYPMVTGTTFKRFEDGDNTKTKKYVKFMLDLWINRDYHIKNSTEVVNLVNMFDELLPYIKNKDIYHKDYKDIGYFLKVINDAMDEKEEKSFVREDHINVIHECDEYILLQPKTHKGSCKYGANTKWCTASKKDEHTFNRYNKSGFLVYLISKINDKGGEYQKIAFYCQKTDDPLAGQISVFNSLDTSIQTNRLIINGWNTNELFKIISMYRANFANWKLLDQAKQNITSVLKSLSDIDFGILSQSIKVVESIENDDYINDVKNKINQFIEQIPVKL